MNRWVGFFIFAFVGLALFWCGLQMPVHLRAVDGAVLQKAGNDTPTLVAKGLTLVTNNQLSAAQLFLAAARTAWITNSHTLSDAIVSSAARPSSVKQMGRFADLLEPSNGRQTGATSRSFAEFIILSEHRTKALGVLRGSPSPLTQELLRLRTLTNTVLFPSSASTSGQAFDAAIAMTGLLAEDGHLSSSFNNALLALAADANRGANPQLVEQALMDLLSLGQRFDLGQLTTFVKNINDTETLRMLTALARRDEGMPVIFTAVCLTGNGAGVAKYLSNFSKTGLSDLRLSLNYGAGGVNQLLLSNQQLCDSVFCQQTAALAARTFPSVGLNFALREPTQALAAKWFLYLLGGFLIATGFHCARRVTALEKPLEVRGFHIIREVLFALVILIVVLFLSEPFLSQGNQKVELPFRLRLPMVGSASPAGNTGVPTTVMNQVTFLTMLLFFVLQSLLYVASLVKLAEIRRQRVAARVKLKLLENEDHLFDAGLYLGFLGTIISLILVSLGVFKQPSLMAAYSATSFGILFVVLFKVLHLRPARRHLLMQAETESPIHLSTGTETPLAAPL